MTVEFDLSNRVRSTNRIVRLSLGLLILGAGGCGRGDQPPPAAASRPQPTDLEAEVVRFCGDCHAYPEPETFARAMWAREVEQGFGFYRESGRHDLDPPPVEDVIAYYESRAPEKLALDAPSDEIGGPLRFREKVIERSDIGRPGVAHLNWLPESNELLVSDMAAGDVSRVVFADAPQVDRIVHVPHPAHTARCDFDGDGVAELLISDLGSFDPADHYLGQVVLAKLTPAGELAGTTVLANNLGRVASTLVTDVDGDAADDIVVAEFGWRRTGRLLWLRNVGGRPVPQFEATPIHNRHGVSHLALADLSGDGRAEIVTLISQEHEKVETYEYQPRNGFRRRELFAAGNPSYGSTMIELADLDGDADLDVIYANGDSFDSYRLNPAHSLQWLENSGSVGFTHRHVAYLPGAFGATAADFDQDGDLDLAACTMTWNFQQPFTTLAWFEQTEPGAFERHNLEFSTKQHACLTAGDFDGDGDVDLAVGHFEIRPLLQAEWLSLWYNDGPARH